MNLVVKFLSGNKLRVSSNLTNGAFHLPFILMQQSLFLQRLFAATSSLLPSIKTEKNGTYLLYSTEKKSSHNNSILRYKHEMIIQKKDKNEHTQ